MNKEQAEQKIFQRRVAILCVLGMQSDRYHMDLDFKDALDKVWEMIPEPYQLIMKG